MTIAVDWDVNNQKKTNTHPHDESILIMKLTLDGLEIRSPYSLKQGQIKNKCVSGTSLKILGSFPGKNINLCILKGIFPFKMHKIIFFPFKMHKIIFFPFKMHKILFFYRKLEKKF